MKNKRFTVLFVCLSFLLVMVLAFSACGTKTTPATTAPPAPTTTAPTTAKPTTTAPAATTAAPTTATTAAPTTAATPAKAPPTGTLRVATTDFTYESTDPIYYESFWGWSMYDPLLSWDQKGTYVGVVAESWSISPDGNTWTFKIRKGIKFWNGDPLTAADVKFSVDRFGSTESTNPWSRYLSEAYNKKSSAVKDEYTFEFVTNKPEPSLVIPFAWTRILPKAYFEKVGQAAFRKAPMGSGPWKFVSHVPKTSFTMEANTDYWDKTRVPGFKTLLNLMVPEESTQVNMLKNNEIDLIGVSMDNIVALQKAGFKTQEFGLPVVGNYNFQGTWLPTAGAAGDIRVRRAMSLALNREEIAQGYYKGNAVPGGGWFMHPGSYGWSDEMKPDPYDPAMARLLLDQAGYPAKFGEKGRIINIYASPGPGVEFITLLQSYWKKVGIEVKLNLIDSTVWGGYFFNPANRIKDGDPNVGWIFVWVFGSTQNSTYHASNMFGSWGAHNTANDPKADEMYRDATSELDPVKAVQKWTAFSLYVRTLYISTPVCIVKPLMVVGPNVGAMTGKNWISTADAYDGFQPAKR